MSRIRLQSSDGEIFDVDATAAKTSGTIRNMLHDCGIENDSDTVVPLPNVTANILRKVLDYAIYHRDDPIPLEEDDILDWNERFMKVDHETMFQLLLAANYLDMNELLNLVSKAIANFMKHKSAEEIRKTFDLVNDFTPEEKEQVRRENEWCGEY